MLRVGCIRRFQPRRSPPKSVDHCCRLVGYWRSLVSSSNGKITEKDSPLASEKHRKSVSSNEEGSGRSSLLSEIIRQQKILKEKAEKTQPTKKKAPEPFRISPENRKDATVSRGSALKPKRDAPTDFTSNPAAPAPAAFPSDGLFDVFQIPEPPKPVTPRHRSPDAFPKESVDQYWEILEPVLLQPKARKQNTAKPIPVEVAKPAFDWLRSEEPAVDIVLPLFERALSDGVEPLQSEKSHQAKAEFLGEVTRQRERFCETMGFTEEQAKMAEGVLLQVTNLCAKHAKGLPMDVVWQKVKESGICYKKFLHNMLYVSATFSTASLSARRKRQSKFGHLTGTASILDALDPLPEMEIPDMADESGISFVDMTDEIAIYHDLLYTPTEQSINVRVKLLVAQGKAEDAENLLDANASGEVDLRLRGYMPVLRLYLELGDISSALRLYTKMRNMSTVYLDVEAYMHVIAGIAEHGYFAASAEPIEGAKELGYKNAAGPGLFDELCSELAAEVIEVPEGSGKKLYNALARGFPKSSLKETSSLAPLRVNDDRAPSNELFACRVRIDPATGVCPRTGLTLKLIQLEESQKEKLVKGLMSHATSQQSKFLEKNKSQRNRQHPPAHENLMRFYKWLDQRDGEPFTTLIDGANVGYFQQNYENGRFSYHQIKFVIDSLERMGENVLVVLPAKYTKDWFQVSATAANYNGAKTQQLTNEEKAIRNELLRENKIIRIPPGHLGTSGLPLFLTTYLFLKSHAFAR